MVTRVYVCSFVKQQKVLLEEQKRNKCSYSLGTLSGKLRGENREGSPLLLET